MSQVPPPMGGAPVGYQTSGPNKPQGLAIAALVCGIIALLSFCFWPLAVPLGIAAIVLGVIGQGKAKRGEAGGEGLAKTGMILGIAAVALSVILTIAMWAGFSFLGDWAQRKTQELEQQQQQMEQNDGTSGTEDVDADTTVEPTTQP